MPSALQPDKLIGDKAILVGTWHWTHTQHNYNWCNGPEISETIESDEDDYSFIMEEQGKLKFLKNDNLLESHDIFFKHFTPIEDGDFIFAIYLDELNTEYFSGIINDSVSIMTFRFPYVSSDEGCEEYKNYFTKE